MASQGPSWASLARSLGQEDAGEVSPCPGQCPSKAGANVCGLGCHRLFLGGRACSWNCTQQSRKTWFSLQPCSRADGSCGLKGLRRGHQEPPRSLWLQKASAELPVAGKNALFKSQYTEAQGSHSVTTPFLRMP